MRLRFLVLAAILAAFPSAAWSQCGTTAPANKFCGNDTGSSALATWKSIPSGALSPIAGGTVLGNNGAVSAVPSALTNPVLGVPGSVPGAIGIAGGTSGTAVIQAQPVAGTPVLVLPNTSGTFAVGAAAPLALSATTGGLSITGLAGGVLAGSGPAFTVTPVLGVPGASQGSLGFAGATSGTVTVQAQATAGTATLTLPNASGVAAVNATSPIVLSATTGMLTCPTCVTSSGGGAITGTAPISVSGAGVVSINAPYTTLTASNGGIVYSGATNLAILAGTATAGQMLRSGASAAPSWSTATWPATTTINQILYSSAANTVSGIAAVNNAVLSTNGSGVPSLSTTLPSGIAATNMNLTTPTLGVATGTSLALGGATIGTNALAVNGTAFIQSSAAAAFSVGAAGATNPALVVDASTASSATGISIKSAAAAGGAAIAVVSSGTNEALSINAKGSGAIAIGNVSTGAVTITPATTLSNALTYGGVTLSNSVTGTGSMVLGTSPTIASPTISGTMAGSFTMSGNVTRSGQSIFTGTAVAASASGNTNIAGTLAAVPTLTHTGQATVFNTAAGGLNLQGNGSTDDIRIYNKSGGLVLNVPTGTTVPRLPGLSSGVCSSGLALDASNNIVTGACPGAAASVQVGVTTITSGSGNGPLTNNSSVLGNVLWGQLPGIATNTAATAGNVGEVQACAGTSAALTTTTVTNMCSINLTAGDWDIKGQVQSNTSGGTSTADWYASIAAANNTLTPTGNTVAAHVRVAPNIGDFAFPMTFTPTQLLLSASATYYLNVQWNGSGTPPSMTYRLEARRMR